MDRFANVLVYSDGRPESGLALDLALALTEKQGGRVTALHVSEPLLPAPGLDAELAGALAAGQEEVLEGLRQRAAARGVEIACETRAGRPFVEIIRRCVRAEHDLVVKVATGRGRLGSPLLGSTALHLVRKCPAPVWLVGERGEGQPRRVMAVLSAERDSPERRSSDRRVLEVALALVQATRAELRVGAAWEAPGQALLRPRVAAKTLERYVEGARRDAEEALGHALAPFGAAIHPARVHLVAGIPYEQVPRLVDLHRSDVVVVGTSPPGPAAPFLVREESEELINRLGTSIVAVKPEGFVSPVRC